MFSDERMFSEYFLKFLLLNIQFYNNYFKDNLVDEWPEQRRLSYFKNIVVRLKVLIADHLFNTVYFRLSSVLVKNVKS